MKPQRIPCVIENVSGIRIIVRNAGKRFLNFRKRNFADAAKHRRADENQHRRRRICRNHSRERRQKETGQKTKRGEHRSQPGAPAHVDSRDAFDVSRA